MALPTAVRAHGRAFLTFVAGLALAVAFLIPSARVDAGSTIVVNTTADSLAVDGHCSLREAVLAANAGHSVDTCKIRNATRTIVLPPGRYVLAIPGRDEDASATGDLDLRGLTIVGAGAGRTVIDANGIDRALEVLPGASVGLYGLTVTGGNTNLQPGTWEDGAGILNLGTLSLSDATVTSNSGRAGGIFSSGTLKRA